MRRAPGLKAAGLALCVMLALLLAIDIDIRVELLGHLFAAAASAPRAPTTLVLGAEVYANGRPSPALQSRLDVAIALYASGKTATLVMSAGRTRSMRCGPTRWPATSRTRVSSVTRAANGRWRAAARCGIVASRAYSS